MVQPLDEIQAEEELAAAQAIQRRRRWPLVLGAIGLLLLAALAGLWLTRETIADNIIAGKLNELGLPGTYKIESIGPTRQVLSNVVIGDPAHPDLTIERTEITILPRFGFPRIGEVKLIRARLYGSYTGGIFSLGTLDKALQGGDSTAPFRLPDLDLVLEDARALIDSDYGPIGAKLEGRGNLSGGFDGIAAVSAPRLVMQGCTATTASLYGKLAVVNARPLFTGPVRLGTVDCKDGGFTLKQSAMQIDARIDPALDGAEAKLTLASGLMGYGTSRADSLSGTMDITYRKAALTTRYDLTARGLKTSQASAATLSAKGILRGADGLARIESEGTITGTGLRPGAGLDAALASAQAAGKDSLAEPLIAQFRSALARNAPGSRFAGDFVLRQTGAITNLVVPQASVIGGGGDMLLAVSRLQMTSGGRAAPRIAGNFNTGGPGMPRISGRMERLAGGTTLLTMNMAEYSAGTSRLALPELKLIQGADGAFSFSGRALASGPLPGGGADGLVLPLDGSWKPGGELRLWQGCRDISFTMLKYASLQLERRSVRLCPGPSGTILRSGPAGTNFAATTSALELAGRINQTPIRISGGPVSIAFPGKITASKLLVTIGVDAEPTRFAIGELSGVSGKSLSGTFAKTEAAIHAVPFDMTEGSGMWSYAGGVLEIIGGNLRLLDQMQVDRFAPLIARDATLTLKNNVITAQALLREPASDRAVSQVTILHDLNKGTGHADLAVPGITFDRNLQPTTLTELARGVLASARGIVTGKGRVEWNAAGVTSNGDFSTEGLDFTAGFGLVKGLSGTVYFSDLIGMVTAPDQKVKIASINPGIEANDGVLTFEIQPESLLVVKGANWPFLDGTLRLLPTRMKLGAAETRRFEMRVDGINAARFIEEMELGNLSATGTFDGNLPMVFDENGGRIDGGVLSSRPPGGNVSYVGELTYKDLSAMGNFAFDALRSIDYKQMRIGMDGDLAGELVTTLRFDGVTQGQGAKRNFITKQIGKLPIRFNVTVRGPFYQLISNFKSLYSAEYVRSPQSAGLLDDKGQPIRKPAPPQQPIQPPVSELRP